MLLNLKICEMFQSGSSSRNGAFRCITLLVVQITLSWTVSGAIVANSSAHYVYNLTSPLEDQILGQDQNEKRIANDVHYPSWCECGVKRRQDVKIVGGVLSKEHCWPWVAAIVYVSETKGPKVVCGSSVISQRYLLTAAHCVHYILQQGLQHFRLVLGTNDLNDSNALSLEILSAISHPRFDPSTLENDIGLLELESPLEYSRSILPICITPQVGVPYVKRNAIVAGWGSTYFGGTSVTMQMQTMVGVISNSDCQGHYNDTEITKSMICAQRMDKDSCQGDSGGPLFLLESGTNDQYLQVGVVSFGKGCADSQYPGIYTRVSRFTKWIQSRIGAEDMCRRNRNRSSSKTKTKTRGNKK